MGSEQPTLPPFVATLNSQQPCSHLQASFLVNGDIKTFQVPLKSLEEKDVFVAVEKLKAEALAVIKV